MTGLRQLLAEEAGEARTYDVTDRAVRVVKRRQLVTRLVPVAAALLVVAGLLAVGLPFGGHDGPDPAPVAAGLPARLVAEASPPVLPGEHGAGRAALAYSGDAGWVVVMTDGRQYRVDGLRVDGISPDGRWLLVARSDGTWVLRDLTGTARQEFGGGGNGATTAGPHWSPDGRRLVLQVGVTYLVDLAAGGSRATVPLDDRVCAVRNSGMLVLCPAPLAGLRLADGTTGRVLRDIPAAELGLRPTESVPADLATPMLGPDDRTLFIGTRDTAGRYLVGFDLDAGRLSERYPLPDAIPAAERSLNGGVEYGQPDERYLIGIHPDGPLLLHVTPSRSDPYTAGTVSIELIAKDTGALTTVTQVSRPITLICYPG
ncbi:hypothetical protein [Dactylosporangium sp. CS-033363]|uniref:hypothetical protein n=1 Tax=Dactylosporangium sp. CS-033363 TaxID=3239935 RepID=UPI003D935AAA